MINSYIFVFESMSSIYAYLANLYFFLSVALARAPLLVGRKGEKSTKLRRRIEFSMAAPRVPLPQLLLLVVAVLVAAAPVRRASGAGQFDVRRHLSTVTRCPPHLPLEALQLLI